MAIDGERLRRIRELFETALPLDPEARRSFLDAECADAPLRAEVEALLDASGGDGELGIEGLIPARSRFRVGDTLGPYTILERIGVGGIGEVYRARDQKLEKDVAIKVLSAEFSRDESRFARFRSEARTLAALNHPHIVLIHHAGEIEGSWFLVMEFVNGETLAERIRRGPIPVREALRTAAEIAGALEAAHEHEMRIVHRDLKPANIMLAADGGAKVLDFGLAQPLGNAAAQTATAGPSASRSVALAIEGTPPYMSPEQLRGAAPHRSSDVWAFGCVLYEMLAGKPAFPGDGPDIVAEILKGEPDWRLLPAETPPEIVKLLRRCLSKNRRGRLRDIGDARIEIEDALEQMGSGGATHAPAGLTAVTGAARPWRRSMAALGMALVAVGALAVALIALNKSPDPPPSFQQISFRRGTIWRARFTPDGRTVVYSATWNGGPIETYSTRGDSSSTRSEFQDADLLAISSRDELALLQQPTFMWWFIGTGTLATASLGGAPRALLNDVQEADWAPDGRELAVTRNLGGRNQLEYPIGRTLYETSGYISSPRVSPSGNLVAFLDHPLQSDNRGWVATVDTDGNRKVLSGEWGAVEGLAWSRDGKEVWFSANRGGESSGIYAVSLSGVERVVARGPGNWVLHDLSRDGRALVTASPITVTMGGLGADDIEQDLSWLDFAGLVALSGDGSTYVFTHWGEGSGPDYSTYLRKTDGTPAVRLGEGAGLALSPDMKWVLTLSLSQRKLRLLPTGPGEARTLDTPEIEDFGFRAAWFPDGSRILFNGRDSNHAVRAYVAMVDGSQAPVPVTPEGVTGSVISSDGRLVVGTDTFGNSALYPLDGGSPLFIHGLDSHDWIVGWSADPRVLHIARYGDGELQAVRLDVSSGFRQTFKRIHLADTSGMTWPPEMLFTPDGSRFVYQTTRTLSTLYVVDGLR